MIALLEFARAFVTALICILLALGFLPQMAVGRLVRLQKFLSKQIERRRLA